MNNQKLMLIISLVIAVAVVAVDMAYVSTLEKTFLSLEKERIITSNKLATAKIVYENLNHVRDLVFKNMDFPGQKDSVTHETRLFEFITTCVNDLKLKLVSVVPFEPVTVGRITTFGYDVELEGDFFKFGELCAKYENSRRIISVETFNVGLLSGAVESAGPGNEGIRVKMRINTFRVKKI